MADIIFPDGSSAPEPGDGYLFVDPKTNNRYRWDGLISHWVDEKGEIFRPTPITNLPQGYTVQPSLFDGNKIDDEYYFWGDYNSKYDLEEREKKLNRNGGCECGVWVSRDSGIHSDWCPLSKKGFK